MARSGQRFTMPDGSVYVVTTAASETAGEYVEMEFVLPSGCVPPPPHVHRSQVEEYEVLEGRFEVTLNGEWRTLHQGDSLSIGRGALHTFRNRSGQVVRVRNRHTPAMRFEDFIERVHATLRAGGVKRKRDPRVPVYLSMVLLEFPDTLAPGRAKERIPLQVLAWLGRRLGLRTTSSA